MARSIASGAFSPPPVSSTASQSNGATTKLNIVSRLAIDGRAKQGTDGAHVNLYLKLNVPLDAVSPSQIIPIFAEEGVKLKDHQVHPLDSESAPYDFSLRENPLLSKAARALNLPARTTKSYLSLFDPRSHHSSSHTNGSVVSELEQRYSGYIIVSGYNICFVLPKEFPPSSRSGSDGNGADGRNLSRSGRRSSVLGRATLQYMVALDLWVPFTSKPPKAPYLISIPIPRCLSNTIKFRLFPPASLSTSFASLSSDEDAGGWDLATIPHVNRTSMKHSTRPNAYNTFADDESSESSLAGLYDNCLVQGTFTSTDCISVRWASPLKGHVFPEQVDGRRRAQVESVKSMMTCTILEQVSDGVKLRLDYQGICSNIWFPGVATLLGLDVVLDTQGCQVHWPSIAESRWTIDGDPALTGFNIGPPHGSLSRQSSLELPTMTIATNGLSRQSTEDDIGSIPPQSGSTASLLRVPIPSQATTEYSFEDSPLTTPMTTDIPSSAESLTPSMSRSSLALAFDSETEKSRKSPSTPITLHINMNDLLAAPKNKFTFNISGTVIISRNSAMSSSQYSVSTSSDNPSIQLPVFRITTCEHHDESSFVRNNCDGANVELINSGTGGSTISQEKRGGSNRKVVIPPGSHTKCGLEFSEILVAPMEPISAVKSEESMTPMESRGVSPPSRPLSYRSNHPDRKGKSRADGKAIIPWVNAKISPLFSENQETLSYAGTLTLPVPVAVSESTQWLEFGFSVPPSSSITPASAPDVSVICASIDGIPVPHEVSGILREAEGDMPPATDAIFENKKWLMWVRVKMAFHGTLEIVYTTKFAQPTEERGWLSKKGADENLLSPLFLPHFYTPVARMQVDVDVSRGIGDYQLFVLNEVEHKSLCSGSLHEFDLKPLGTPHAMLARVRPRKATSSWQRVGLIAIATLLLFLSGFALWSPQVPMNDQLQHIWRQQAEFEGYSSGVMVAPLEVTKIITMTVTATPSLESASVKSQSFSEEPVSAPSATLPPTIILSTPDNERQYETQVTSLSENIRFAVDWSSLVKFIYEPFKWQAQIQVEDVKKFVNSSWMNLKKTAVLLFHWPLGVPEDTE